MRLKKVVAIIIMAFISVMIYQLYHHKDIQKRPRDDVVVVRRIKKQKKLFLNGMS